MLNELLKSALVLLVSFAVKYILGLIGVVLDEATFNSIVAGLVTYFLSLLGLGVAAKFAPRYFSIK
jgi:hypothetical protein